ncbi:MAG TPA: hypothetical protein ENK43_15285 [Planctomycetes bacterium]|nr:hypothetical protein [Planctomycetota bacterium]
MTTLARTARIVAIALAAAILWRAWVLAETLGAERLIRSLEVQDGTPVEGPEQILRTLSRLSPEKLTPKQRTRVTTLRRDAALRLFLARAELDFPGGESRTLAELGLGALGVDPADAEGTPWTLSLDDTATELLGPLAVNGRPLDLEDGKAPIALEGESIVRVATRGEKGRWTPLISYPVIVDDKAPEWTVQVGDSPPTVPPTDELFVLPGESLSLAVKDLALLLDARVRYRGADIPSAAKGRSLRQFVIADPLSDGATGGVLELSAVDGAGHATHARLRVQRMPRRLREIRHGHRIVPEGGLVTAPPPSVALAFFVDGLAHNESLRLRGEFDQALQPLPADGPSGVVFQVPATNDAVTWAIHVVDDRNRVTEELGTVRVQGDTRPPRITLVDAQGDPHTLESIPFLGPTEYTLLVEDESSLTARDIKARAREGVRLGTPRLKDGRYERKILVSAPGRLRIEATDQVGRQLTKDFVFATPSATVDEDAPSIRLTLGDVEVPPGGADKFLWKPTSPLILTVEDPSGLELVNLVHGRVLRKLGETETLRRWILEAKGPIAVEASDKRGHVARRSFNLNLVTSPPVVISIAGRKPKAGEPFVISGLPTTIRFTAEQPPLLDGPIEAVFVGSDGKVIPLPSKAGSGTIPDEKGISEGAGILRLRFHALNGVFDVTEVPIVIKRAG